MRHKMRIRMAALLLTAALCFQAFPASRAADADFTDVFTGHWAYHYIKQLRALGITDGVGDNRFAPDAQISRASFVTFLCRLMEWTLVSPSAGSFDDNRNTSAWYFPYIETALSNGAVMRDSAMFRPEEPITREEMAVALVRTLGYDALAQKLAVYENPFTDVHQYKGHIAIARDLGITSGVGGGRFEPDAPAQRAQAAAMMVRMYDALHRPEGLSNAFYAIQSGSQMEAVSSFDSLCFGWARLSLTEGTPALNTTISGGNEYYIPPGYQEPYALAQGRTKYLFIAVDNAPAAAILSNPALRRDTAALMAEAVAGLRGPDGETVSFDGVVVDFEGLSGAALRDALNEFLQMLRGMLAETQKLAVAVHPQRRAGQSYYDGYDYRAIGELADMVILMAHDYNAKQLTQEEMERGVSVTPLSPLDEVYVALRAITAPDTGVRDLNKIVLQISFGTAQWKLQDGKVIHPRPYTPAYSAIERRIATGVAPRYDQTIESPYITFYNAEDQTDNIVWYEDARSVKAKRRLASLFGVTGVSVWRLGIVPEEILTTF